MYAVRQIQQVENGQVIIHLPADFTATRVEIIILPVEPTNGHSDPPLVESPNEPLQQILTWDTSNFDAEQLKAYQRLCEIARKWKPGDPPVFGAFEGLVKISDDFNDPLPDDIIDLFYGSETDEYGMSLPQ